MSLEPERTLIPPDAETVLGEVYTKLMAKLPGMGMFDAFIGYERFPNKIKAYMSGDIKQEDIARLVDSFNDTVEIPSKDTVEIQVKYYQSEYEEVDCWVLELFPMTINEPDKEPIPTEVDIEGDIEMGDEISSEEKVMADSIQCINCGKVLLSDDIEVNLETDLLEDAQMVCPVCHSEFAISALLTKSGEDTPDMNYQEEPGATIGDAEPEVEEEPSSEGEGVAGEEDFQITAESVSDDVSNLVESGFLDFNSAYDFVMETDTNIKSVWKGPLEDFQSKLFGLADELFIEYTNFDILIKELCEKDVVNIEGDSITVDCDKAVDLLVDFIQEKNTKANQSDPLLPDIDGFDTDIDITEPESDPISPESNAVSLEPELNGDISLGNLGESDDTKDDLKLKVEIAVRKYFG